MMTKRLAISGVVIALYIVLMFVFQGISFLQAQSRVATALYSLGYVAPFLAVPLGIANALGNLLFGGLGLVDIIGGFIVGVLTTYVIGLLGKYKAHYMLVGIPVLLIPSILVPVWLGYLLGMPYLPLAASIFTGQIFPTGLAVMIVRECREFTK